MMEPTIESSASREMLVREYVRCRAPWLAPRLESNALPVNVVAHLAVLPRATAERCIAAIDDLADRAVGDGVCAAEDDPDTTIKRLERRLRIEYVADLVPELARALGQRNRLVVYDACREIFERLTGWEQLSADGPPAGDGLPQWLFLALSTEEISIESYVSSSTRRSAAEMGGIRALIYRIVERDKPMSVRQVFYRLVTAGAIDKTETEYSRTVVRLLTEMRLGGYLPFEWLSDATRWQRKPDSYSSIGDAVRATAEFYRQAIWRELPDYVEVWLEKEALAGVLFDVTADFDVPLMVCRGYSSLTFLHSAAEAIGAKAKRTFIYYFGDHDPSGKDISANVERRLREFAPGAEIHFERVAVTPEQIAEWNLPSRPTKQTDSRASAFEGESTEVDAIEPDTLRALCRECIERHIPAGYLDAIEAAERSEREIGLRMAGEATGPESA